MVVLHFLIKEELTIYRVYAWCERMWRRGLVVDTWPMDPEIWGSSPGCARSTLSLWERLFICITSPHSCVKRVPDYRQCARVDRHL